MEKDNCNDKYLLSQIENKNYLCNDKNDNKEFYHLYHSKKEKSNKALSKSIDLVKYYESTILDSSTNSKLNDTTLREKSIDSNK